MKNLIFTLFAGLFITAASYAQSDVHYGIKGGLNYANFIYEFEDSNNDFLDFNSKVGFYLGGFVNVSLSDKISLQPELLYSGQGAKLDVDFNQIIIFDQSDGVFRENQNDVNVKQSKLLLPILLEYKVNDAFSFYFGPQVTYLINFEDEFETGEDVNIARFSDSEKFGVDVTARLGYHATNNVSFELGYFRGLTNQNSVKSSVFQLGLAYTL